MSIRSFPSHQGQSIFSQWTKKYNLSKTLRFELKPVSGTKPFLDQFIEWDTQRAEDYKRLKKIIDEYHKDHIQKALSQDKILSVRDLKVLGGYIKKLKNLQEHKEKEETNKLVKKTQKGLREQIKKRFSEIQAELRKSFAKEGSSKPENPKSKKNPLFEKELITKILPAWLAQISWENMQNKEAEEFKNKEAFSQWKKESLEIVKKFDKFTTYLGSFHKNRKNIYSDKEQSTAISYRIIHENFPRFLSNADTYKKITKNYPDLKKQLESAKSDLKAEFDYFKIKSAEELFEMSFFNKCLSQEGIDNYNYIIGGKKLKGQREKNKGINEKINLYRQQKNSSASKNQDIKTKLSNKNLPFMQALYKQILSDRQGHSFYGLEEFKDRKEVLSAIDEFYKSLLEKEAEKEQNTLQRLKTLFTEKLSNSSLDEIYFKNSEINRLSHKLFKDYSLISSSLRHYVEEYVKKKAEFSTKGKRDKWLKKDFFSFDEIHKALLFYSEENEELKEIISSFPQGSVPKKTEDRSTFKDNHSFDSGKPEEERENILLSYFYSQFNNKLYNEKKEDLLSHIKSLYQEVQKVPPTSAHQFNEKETEATHNFLKALMALFHLVKPTYLEKPEDLYKDTAFYDELKSLYEKLLPVVKLYDKARNYITKNKKHLKKIKINFEDPTLLDGWDVNKESDNLSVILRRKENGQWIYYLGVMNRENRKIFDYHLNFDDRKKESVEKFKKELRKKLEAGKNDKDYYEKMNYKYLPGPNKMLPKVFFSEKNRCVFDLSSDIEKINKNKTYTKSDKEENNKGKFNLKDCHKLIDFFKQSIDKHYDWKKFSFQFSETNQYKDISEFYNEIASQGYKLAFDKIKAGYIEEKIKKGELYLFQIYNKDFSQTKKTKGRANLHTSYFKLLFDEDNLKDTVFKLNGQAEIFFRKASKKKQITHPKNKSIENKNLLNSKKKSKFCYDLIKDKRFTEDKFFFHVPITLNFKEGKMKSFSFNQKVLEFLKNNQKMNIIGIDRGERHLAYYTVINQKRKILEQGSFNQITTKYKNKDGQSVELKTDYHKLLENREKERDKGRKSWTKIESIKELKSGYLSYLTHKITQLMIKHKAIVVFEDLNTGFKRGRMKFEKQVYQKLEKALIDKLNYLVFKDKNKKEPGGFLKAYQLSAPFESFQEMGKQTGFIFYTPAYYTSKVCPLTGFVNLIYPRYENVRKSQDFFKKFESISFDSQAGHFVFEYRDGVVNSQKKSESNALWKVCSHGKERYKYDFKKKTHKEVDVTKELKDLFKKYNINYEEENNLIEGICQQEQKDFFFKLFDLLKLNLQLRHINPQAETDKKRDFILSPVADESGRFFDSREVKPDEPQNGDANGAYHIALKGLWTLQNIEDDDNKGKKLKIEHIKNKDWFEFIRSNPFLPKGKKVS